MKPDASPKHANLLRKATRKMLAVLIARLPAPQFEMLVQDAIELRVRRLSAAEALRMLFRLDDRLYMMQGRKAIEYGNGTHTKHRHIRYHDFFTSRINSRETVLDIGCGIGALAHDIAQKTGARVVGIDISQSNIEQAHRDYAHDLVEYRVGRAPDDLPAGVFDVVVLSNVLEHIADRPAFLRRIIESAGPSRFLIRVPLFERDWRVPLKKELGLDWRLDSTHETEFTNESFESEMEAATLKMVHQEIRWGEIWAEVSPITGAGRS